MHESMHTPGKYMSRWRVCLAASQSQGLGLGWPARGRRRPRVADAKIWTSVGRLVKQTVPLLRMLSSCTVWRQKLQAKGGGQLVLILSGIDRREGQTNERDRGRWALTL
jgi:hypothetical protein